MKPIPPLLTLLLLAPLAALPAPGTPAKKPNILLIVADDLGYGDLGCYGATKIKTPNIDRLAGEGVRFTDAHAPAAVCQPSRYAILSGTYFMRARRQGQQTLYFHEGQVTLPSLLKTAGYRTAAIGKWHLGFGRGAEPDYNAELKPGPLEIGFDSFFGCPRTHNEPPFVFVENHRVVGLDPADPLRIIPHDEVVKRGLKDWNWGASEGAKAAHAARPQDRLDLILADKAAQFVSEKSDQPFFLYLAFLAPHVPIAPAPEFQGTSQAGRYGDFIQQLDACVGKVLEALQARGLTDHTLVFFTSDNGAVLQGDALAAGHRANGILLGQKTDAWEGGHRVPFIARWPGRIPAGTRCDRLLGLTDLMATIAAVANVPLPAGAAPDSLNQLSAFNDPTKAPAVRTEMLAQGTGGYALRQGDWVCLPKQGSGGMTVQVPAGKPWGQPYAKLGLTNSDVDTQGRIKPDAPQMQLYNLRDDPAQATNRFNHEPDIVQRLAARLEKLVPKRSAKK
jgi:arylsulfatase A-like enzyme